MTVILAYIALIIRREISGLNVRGLVRVPTKMVGLMVELLKLEVAFNEL